VRAFDSRWWATRLLSDASVIRQEERQPIRLAAMRTRPVNDAAEPAFVP
jgi:hypothetical protein